MQIIKARRPGTKAWLKANSAQHDTGAGTIDPGRALARLINDMVVLSAKIDSFCLHFELARKQNQKRAGSQYTHDKSTVPRAGK